MIHITCKLTLMLKGESNITSTGNFTRSTGVQWFCKERQCKSFSIVSASLCGAHAEATLV